MCYCTNTANTNEIMSWFSDVYFSLILANVSSYNILMVLLLHCKGCSRVVKIWLKRFENHKGVFPQETVKACN